MAQAKRRKRPIEGNFRGEDLDSAHWCGALTILTAALRGPVQFHPGLVVEALWTALEGDREEIFRSLTASEQKAFATVIELLKNVGEGLCLLIESRNRKGDRAYVEALEEIDRQKPPARGRKGGRHAGKKAR